MENLEQINEAVKKIKNFGIKVALDDFGQGYSSLTELRELDIDAIKIDKVFIDKINKLDENELITEEIIAAGHKLRLTIIAEGVETEKQYNYLKNSGCDIIQGFYISKPLEKEEAIDFLKKHNKTQCLNNS